jgi:hypothetical protein
LTSACVCLHIADVGSHGGGGYHWYAMRSGDFHRRARGNGLFLWPGVTLGFQDMDVDFTEFVDFILYDRCYHGRKIIKFRI